MNQPLVSVVIPAYNGGKTLKKCLNSVLCQSYSHIQVIVVNDGSTDDTGTLLDAYAARDHRVLALHQQNAGVSTARNNALAHCEGVYVQFVDCDDTLPPDSIRTMVTRAEADGSDLVIGAYNMVLGNLSETKDLGKRSDTLSMDEFLALLCKYPNTFYYGVLWNKLFRRELIAQQNVQFNAALAWGEDFDFITRYLVQAERISYTRQVVYEYVRNPKGLTMKTGFGVVKHPIRAIELKRIIYNDYRELYRQRQAFERHRRDIWKYMVSFTLTE